jgi:hypothetical protein
MFAHLIPLHTTHTPATLIVRDAAAVVELDAATVLQGVGQHSSGALDSRLGAGPTLDIPLRGLLLTFVHYSCRMHLVEIALRTARQSARDCGALTDGRLIDQAQFFSASVFAGKTVPAVVKGRCYGRSHPQRNAGNPGKKASLWALTTVRMCKNNGISR